MRRSEINHNLWWQCCAVSILFLFALALSGSALASDGFRITEAKWESGDNRLVVKGKKDKRKDVTVTNADTGALVGTYTRDREEWKLEKTYSSTSSVPCRVLAMQDDGQTDERNVKDAPSDCEDGGGGPGPGPGPGYPNQTDFKIMMNYELGMHCTGFEFAYCCVLPVYNSILAQVVKPQGNGNNSGFAELLEGDPNIGRELDVLGRETVLRDPELDSNGNFKKYVLRYWHDAQPRNDGNGAAQTSTLISNVEGNSLLAWNTIADAAWPDADGKLRLSGRDGNPLYNGSRDVVLGNCAFNEPNCYDDTGATFGAPVDNYQNAVWNHLYIYEDTEGSNPDDTSSESAKLRLGLHVDYPTNVGPAGHAMGPVGSPLENVLTFSGDTGTVVFTQMKVLENLPVTLTSPRIWEALGLPLTPFEDSINFFGDPGTIDEDSVRPYVAMKAQLYDYFTGDAVMDSHGDPVIGFGTAPIDIPNCERCHSELTGINSAQRPDGAANGARNPEVAALVQQEMAFWMAYYPGLATGSDWYARLKGAAISILAIHDNEHGTGFTDFYPGVDCVDANNCDGGPLIDPVAGSAGDLLSAGDPRLDIPQNTRLGHDSVICQKCHADNVIAVVKSASCGPGNIGCSDGDLIPPLTEAIHFNHRNVTEGGDIVFNDSLGRDGGCQGCHPAHRSDGDMSGYPITEDGSNFYASLDNRDANGGCFVGRDVHSNPMKDVDGAETPSHLNAVGAWLVNNVARDTGDWKGIWCTNCHSQLGQEFWKTENMENLVLDIPGPGAINVRGGEVDPDTANVEAALDSVLANIGVDPNLGRSWLDPKTTGSADGVDRTHDIWAADPGLCNYVSGYLGITPVDWAHDGNVATVRVDTSGACGGPPDAVSCGGGVPDFWLCGSFDGDGDFSVEILDFCTTPDCVTAAGTGLPASSLAVPVPFSAATDGRDHWLSAGEPHCADCHASPYVEQSGNIDAFAPFNYPRKASLMRYSRGHRDITCQGCHESIHGLYPVTPRIDTTSYAQAASLNDDGSHGPLKCGTCHDVGSDGLPKRIDDLEYNGQRIKSISDTGARFDAAVGWAHTFTEQADLRNGYCLNCHGDEWNEISSNDEGWLEHATKGRASRHTMDQAEIEKQGYVSGDPAFENPRNTVCRGCHGDEWSEVSCTGSDGREWKEHLIEGRVAESVWEYVSEQRTGTTCGW